MTHTIIIKIYLHIMPAQRNNPRTNVLILETIQARYIVTQNITTATASNAIAFLLIYELR